MTKPARIFFISTLILVFVVLFVFLPVRLRRIPAPAHAEPNSLFETYGIPTIYKIFKNDVPTDNWIRNNIQLHAAKNEYESFQVVLSNLGTQPISEIEIKLNPLKSNSGDTIPSQNINVHQVEYVKLAGNRDDPSIPPSDYPIPGFFPDPLWPIDVETDRVTIPAQQNLPLWFTVKIPKDISPGIYNGEIDFLQEGGTERTFEVQLRVFNFTLQDEPSLESMFNLGDYYDTKAPLVLRSYHGVIPPDDYPGPLNLDQKRKLEQVVDRYYESFLSHRTSPFLYSVAFRAMDWRVPKFDLDTETDSVWLDFSLFDPMAEKYFDQKGFNTFTVPSFGNKLFEDCIVECQGHIPDDAEKERWRKHAREYFKKLADHLREKGWIDKAYVYLVDEIKPDQAGWVNEVARAVKEEAPDLKTALSYYKTDGLFPEEYLDTEYIDVFIPEARAMGEINQNGVRVKDKKYWVYEFTTQRIDLNGITNRVFPWMAWHYDAKGILYYATNYWVVDRWSKPRITQDDLPNWGDQLDTVNGNGFYFYPPCREGKEGTVDYIHPTTGITHKLCKNYTDRVVPSIRWELLREGMEDYEYLHLLNQVGQDDPQVQELLNQAKNLISNHKEFETNPQVYLTLRQEIATKIESLSSEKLPGDANKDGRVDSEDFALLVEDYLGTPVNNTDFNSDGRVDSEDFAILQGNYLD